MITNDATITIRVNSTTKRQAQKLFSNLGLDMSTAINMFLKKSVNEEAIPFEISTTKRPNLKTRQAMTRAEKGKDAVGPFDTVEEAMDYLSA